MGNKMKNINLSILIIFILNLFNINANANNLTIDNLNSKFLIFIEKEFLNYQINVKNENNQIYIFDKKNNKYFVELNLLTNSYSNQTNENQKAIPILKVKDNNNLYLTSSRTLQSYTNFDLLEIENISKILVLDTINKLSLKGIYFSKFDDLIKDNNIKKIKLTLIGFSDCENDNIIDIMIKEFPGYHHVEIGSSNTFKINTYNYFTDSTIQKIKKWINLVMFENNFISTDYFSKINKNTFDLVKVTKEKFINSCY